MAVADHNTYLKYKREQKLLVYWIVHTSNRIIRSLPNDVNETPNTTGEIRMSSLLSLSALIAKHIKTVPSAIYRLLKSIIAARTQTYSLFQRFAAQNPDPEALDRWSHGNVQCPRRELWTKERETKEPIGEEDDEQVIFSNKFAALNVGPDVKEENEDNEEKEEEEEETPTGPKTARPKKRPGKKGKRAKRGRKSKAKPKEAVKEKELDELPLESYRIIEDEDGIITDYLMAVYSIVVEWVELRQYLQGIWREAAYDGLNTAIAGAVSNIAIGMVSQTQTKIFVDFPGHDSYETIMKTITRGDPDKAQGMFHLMQRPIGPRGELGSAVNSIDIDVKEQFMVYVYNDLIDFITDFQKTRSGKPTKPMLAQIRDWDPKFNPQTATREQRIKWRRVYTINWLYDLVNLFSSIVVQRITMKGQKINLETVDWSTNGPWHVHRRLYGLNEFAGAITGFAMQKPSTDVRPKILPHHVFQLQAIVDSLTVSRGWSNYSLKGHVLRAPARNFRPRRDVDLFMDRDNERLPSGICMAVEALLECFRSDVMIHGRLSRHREWIDLMTEMREGFINFLGESKYMHGLTTIPPSRFTSTNSNGLWEYSPFLCGVGLAEALDLVTSLGFALWDGISEPMCLVHLHNMLVKKKYITPPVGLYQSLQEIYPATFFAKGKIPTSNFDQGLLDVVAESGSRRAVFRRRESRRDAARNAKDFHGILDGSMNRFFKTKSMLTLHREAGWISERIPDSELAVTSVLALVRMAQVKRVKDPVTGEMVLESTDLVQRARDAGLNEKNIMRDWSSFHQSKPGQNFRESTFEQLSQETGYKLEKYKDKYCKPNTDSVSKKQSLELYKTDLRCEISGLHRPISSLNYIWVTARLMHVFSAIENELKRLRNPLWVQEYESNAMEMREKRSALTLLILEKQDPECMEVLAKQLQDPRIGYMSHIYWEDLEDLESASKKADPDEDMVGNCSMM
ncbi:hypothetical protein FQN49_003366 [Arthroderma sp. PD_2]|nr:hypothetical protein FQN49_003366 [Arthroderma sp. PD_2]